MSYLKNNNNKIIVDAVLTKAGQEKLAKNGTLEIVKFAVGDNDIDYTLYNSNHPMGSDYYNSSIINMPILEPSVRDDIGMLSRLITDTEFIPGNMIELTVTSGIPETGINNLNIYTITPTLDGYTGNVGNITYSAKINKPANIGRLAYKFVPFFPDGGSGVPTDGPVRNILPTGDTTGDTTGGKTGGTTGTDIIVGHYFNFSVTEAPSSPVTLTVTITPNKLNVKSVIFDILILGASSFIQLSSRQNQISNIHTGSIE